ncbi:LamG-like jellyroll fold domain-containing protein [Haloferula chungangensis]|uniref:LamG-like jellyroll fold domain-containing protein n=1 Tax=Haloferula chungangensis TaxID=1048331 RepID=A0ABW2L519_9BACT
MMQKFSNREVDRLAERLRSDSLEEPDAGRLREIIRHHPAGRRRLVEQLYLAADLKEAISNRTIERSTSRSGNVIRRWVPVLAGGLAAAAAIALMLAKPWEPEKSQPMTQAKEAASALDSEGIAVISRSSHAVWGEQTSLPLDRLGDGSPIGEGTIELLEGVAQIDFYSGVTVILRAPAKFHLISPELCRLDYGNLWANVPPPARGFRVDSTAFKVVDLGTEFGIKLEKNGQGEVHVLEGEVRVQSILEKGQPERILKSGNAVSYGADHRSKAIAARPREFQASVQLSEGAQARFEEWAAYQATLSQDPDMLIAYTLPRVSSWERQVRNHAEAGPPHTDGAIVGCKWVDGRWPGKGALSFNNSSHRVRLDLPGLYKDLSLACWVRLDDIGSAEVSLIHPETRQDNHIHWTLINVNEKVMHLHFAESAPLNGRSDRQYYHCPVNLYQFIKLGEWVHLGVVYDSKARQVIHYVNGEVIGTVAIEEPRELGVGIADIGNWPYHEWAAGTKWEVRNLDGLMDEFLIAKRAWTPAEMRELWLAGRP